MTQTVPWYPRLDPATGIQLGAVYGYHTLRVDRRTGMVSDGTIEVGYVGQTVQELAERDAQHRGRKPAPGETAVKCQPFSDVMFGEVFVIEVVPVDRLDEREQHHIERLKPAYNHQLQAKDNPNRIQISEARRHRDARDAAKGLPPRVWPALRNPPKFLTQPTGAPARRPARISPAVRRRRNLVLGYAAGWLLQAALWWPLLAVCAARWQVDVPGRVWPVLAAGLAGGPLMFGISRRRHRKAAWLVLAVVTVILAGMVAR
jgi:hypothetical protein